MTNIATYRRPRLIVFTGSRYWGEGGGTQRVWERNYAIRLMVWVRDRNPDATAVVGGCPTGFDAIVNQLWWECWGLPLWEYPAAWDFCGPGCPPGTAHRVERKPGDKVHPGTEPTYCPEAGPRRNGEMLDLRPDECIAVYGQFSLGARKTAETALKLKIPTLILPKRHAA